MSPDGTRIAFVEDRGDGRDTVRGLCRNSSRAFRATGPMPTSGSAPWSSARFPSSPGWNHLQCAYFGQHSILGWTLADDGRDPPQYPNCYRFPLAQITFRVPTAPAEDPQRGPHSPRHKPWFADGNRPTRFDWVPLDASLQWRAFQRLVNLLRQRGDDVLVVLGPFNEHMIAEDNRPAYRQLSDGVRSWLVQHHVPCVTPETLPSALYADASHPLTDGYALLARRLVEDAQFREWLAGPAPLK